MNKGNPMNESLGVLAAHCVRTMPDSMTEQKRLLRALAQVMTVDHPALPKIQAQIVAIEMLERMQQELPGFFEQ